MRETDWTPRDAAATLQRLEAMEPALTARTAGLTNLVWGIAGPLVFLTYGSASDWVEAHDASWLYAVLWLPGVALGITTTALLWNNHALSLHRRLGGGWRTLAYPGAFLVLGGILWLAADRALGLAWTPSTLMTATNGLFAALVAEVEARDGVPHARVGYVAGAWMLLAGLALGVAGAGHAASTLLGAAATAVGWTGAGLVMYRRG